MFRESLSQILSHVHELEAQTIPIYKDLSAMDIISNECLRRRMDRGVYVRLRLHDDVSFRISQLCEHIQLESQETFISQLDARAGLGCHPFHITLCGGLYRSPLFYDSVLGEGGVMEITSKLYGPVKTSLLASQSSSKKIKISVSGRGRVLLKLYDRSHCLALGQHISAAIPGCNPWYTETEENLHITIGSYVGPLSDLSSFKSWIIYHFEDIFGENLDAYIITSEVVELSEECSLNDIKKSFVLLGDSS